MPNKKSQSTGLKIESNNAKLPSSTPELKREHKQSTMTHPTQLLGLVAGKEATEPQMEFNKPLNSVPKEEAMDVSVDEVAGLLVEDSWRVQQRWINVQKFEDQGGSLRQSPTPSSSVDYGSGSMENGALISVIPKVEVNIAMKKSSVSERAEGSDLDSDFELDISAVETAAFTDKDLSADEKLDDPIRDIYNVERVMDDEADRLLRVSPHFEWVEDFESFKGIPEKFLGPTPGPVKDYDSPYDAFIDIWDHDIIERIAVETNRYAAQTVTTLKGNDELLPSSRMREWSDTNADEIRALLGVFMFMSIAPRISQDEYWKCGVLSMPNFRRLMAYDRYVLLSKFLHFTDNSDDKEKRANPQLFQLMPVIEHLGRRFDSLYNLGRHISINESLSLLKDLSWMQALRSKTEGVGVKLYELCESQTGYLARFRIYTDKPETSVDQSLGVDIGSKRTSIVLDLLRGLEGGGHCVSMDNFYNCPSLARYLKNSGFDCLGTLRTSRRHVPEDIAKVSKNVPKGTILSLHCGDISIVSWKDSRLVSVISTYHDDSNYVGTQAGKILVKPLCVKDYNNAMEGIHFKNQKLSMYLLERKKGIKWYINMFKRLLNVSIHNAFIMYVSSLKRRNKPAVSHRKFRYQLAQLMVDKHSCASKVREPVEELLRLRRDIIHMPKYESGNKNRGRCVVCYRQNICKVVHSQCSTCDLYLCFGQCWKQWHSNKQLPGKEKIRRNRK